MFKSFRPEHHMSALIIKCSYYVAVAGPLLITMSIPDGGLCKMPTFCQTHCLVTYRTLDKGMERNLSNSAVGTMHALVSTYATIAKKLINLQNHRTTNCSRLFKDLTLEQNRNKRTSLNCSTQMEYVLVLSKGP